MTDEKNVDTKDQTDSSTATTKDENKEATVKNIPYDRFKDVNDKYKSTSEELKATRDKLKKYEEDEKKREDDKLLKEKQYDELLKRKDDELERVKKEQEALKRNADIEKINRKIANASIKEGAIDSEDILQFVRADELLNTDSSKLDEDINFRISELKKNKGHLFGEKNYRDARENGIPSNSISSKISTRPKSRAELVEEMLRNSMQK